jgi:hypothetical protein
MSDVLSERIIDATCHIAPHVAWTSLPNWGVVRIVCIDVDE